MVSIVISSFLRIFSVPPFLPLGADPFSLFTPLRLSLTVIKFGQSTREYVLLHEEAT
jgi:hypothetical protein